MTKKKEKKPLAIFDLDGTIFRSSLVIELTDALISYGVFPAITKKAIEDYYQNWLDRKGEYEEYLDMLVEAYNDRIKGVLENDVIRASEAVIEEQKNRVYRYTRDLVTQLRNSHLLVAISGSPIEIVKIFARSWRFDYYFGTVFETKNGVYTGNMLEQPSQNKKLLLRSLVEEKGLNLKGSLGVGDTESDISFLEEVERPICFNPNKTLYEKTRQRRWEVVVERKNVIYHL